VSPLPAAPPRRAADRADAAVIGLSTAALAVIDSAVKALVAELRAKLAAAYEEAAELRGDADRYAAEAGAWRAHVTADHAALGRVAALVRGWDAELARVEAEAERAGSTPPAAARLLHTQVKAAIGGEGEHGSTENGSAAPAGS
jgi:hypothetical protein